MLQWFLKSRLGYLIQMEDCRFNCPAKPKESPYHFCHQFSIKNALSYLSRADYSNFLKKCNGQGSTTLWFNIAGEELLSSVLQIANAWTQLMSTANESARVASVPPASPNLPIRPNVILISVYLMKIKLNQQWITLRQCSSSFLTFNTLTGNKTELYKIEEVRNIKLHFLECYCQKKTLEHSFNI